MAFGQAAGPPASAQQLKQLTELVLAAGHTGFRDARGPLGLNQRQAAGRFTREEADAFIERLEAEIGAMEAGVTPPEREQSAVTQRAAPGDRREASQAMALRKIPDHLLAGELQRRGWIVVEP